MLKAGFIVGGVCWEEELVLGDICQFTKFGGDICSITDIKMFAKFGAKGVPMAVPCVCSYGCPLKEK